MPKMELEGKSVDFWFITPEEAREWLGYNLKNRPIMSSNSKFLGHALRNDKWELTNDAVTFADDGTLINGQHRLTQIVETGIGAYCIVFRGASPSAQMAMDQQGRRNAAQNMAMRGLTNTQARKGLVNAMVHYNPEVGPLNISAVQITTAEIMEIEEENRADIEYALAMADSLNREIRNTRSAATALTFMILAAAWYEKFEQFREKLTYGTDLGRNDPIRRMRTYLINGELKQNTVADRRKFMALMFKCFNFMVEEREPQNLVFQKAEAWPTPWTPVSWAAHQLASERANKGLQTRRDRGDVMGGAFIKQRAAEAAEAEAG